MQSQVAAALPHGAHFFSRDKEFYKTFFHLLVVLALQNIVTYSVNVADNVMLGAYSQSALSGAAAVNQIQYILQQVTNMGLGEGLVVLASQYWGQRRTDEIQKLTGIAMAAAALLGGLLTAAAFCAPRQMVGLFTSDAAIRQQAAAYLGVMRWTYLLFMCTNLLLAALRSVQVVGIAFKLSIMTLCLNVGINYTLIFGNFGFPELGIRGAAIGTLTARVAELLALLIYIRKSKALPFRFSIKKMFPLDGKLALDYLRVTIPCTVSSLLFSGAVALQTAIFGHLSPDAIAANAASNTMFQYCKMIPISASAASSVWIGRTVGSKNWANLRGYVRTLQVVYLGIGFLVSVLLLVISGPLLKLYDLTPEARAYAIQMIRVLAVTSIGTAYELPCMCGIIRGGGDARFVMLSDMFYSWCVVVPVSILAAFVFRWPVMAVAFCMNVDQLMKCASNFIKTNRYTWIKSLTQNETGLVGG